LPLDVVTFEGEDEGLAKDEFPCLTHTIEFGELLPPDNEEGEHAL